MMIYLIPIIIIVLAILLVRGGTKDNNLVYSKRIMESRNIALTLEKAREWYNSSSIDLREVALQAYTKDELEIPEWERIKTFEDACKVLGISTPYTKASPEVSDAIADHIYAVCKLDIIRKALNKDWKPNLVQSDIYYPYVRFYPSNKVKEAAISYNCSLGPSFYVEGKKYTLISGSYTSYTSVGLTNFGCGFGIIYPTLGLLGCKSREIAEHMSRYFSKEIFEATYACYTGTYQWV